MLKKKPPGSVRTVCSPQNIEAVRQSFIRVHRHSARRHSVALGISDRSVRKILHKDLNFHPYKMMVVHELSDRDIANRSTVVELLIGNLSDDVIILMTYEVHRIFAIGERKIHRSFVNGLFTCTCGRLAWSGKTLVSYTLISLKTKMGVQLQSHLLVM
jgi:hypothetical protein